MAHHQGMSLLALAYLLLGQPMQRRFEADPQLQATLLLLQERVPRRRRRSTRRRPTAPTLRATLEARRDAAARHRPRPTRPSPEVQLLSNGRYHVMVTNAGGGYSRWKDLAVTRWREDGTCDSWGSFCYLRDTETGDLLVDARTSRRSCAARQLRGHLLRGPRRVPPPRPGHRRHTEIVVSPEDDIELRRVRLTNRGRVRRSIEITSYTEVVLAPAAADELHPAFSKLFVQTEVLRQPAALLCTRRPRSPEEPTPWMFHLMAVHGVARRGRRRTRPTARASSAAAMHAGLHRRRCAARPAVRQRRLGARPGGGDAARRSRWSPSRPPIIDIVYGMAESTATPAWRWSQKYQDRRLADRVFELAWTHGQVVLRQLNASEADAQLYAPAGQHGDLFAGRRCVPRAPCCCATGAASRGCGATRISGDLPIVLLRIGEATSIDLVRQLVQAHAWWRLKGLAVDLVIWNEERDIYRQRLQEQIMGLIAAASRRT